MSEGRLPASLEAAALMRRVETQGDFATMLKRGDPDRGSLLLVISSRGLHATCLERSLGPDGLYSWHRVGPGESSSSVEVSEFLQKRTRFDADLWLIELDIADPERFIAETTFAG